MYNMFSVSFSLFNLDHWTISRSRDSIYFLFLYTSSFTNGKILNLIGILRNPKSKPHILHLPTYVPIYFLKSSL